MADVIDSDYIELDRAQVKEPLVISMICRRCVCTMLHIMRPKLLAERIA